MASRTVGTVASARRLCTIDRSASVRQAAERMREAHVGCLIVTDGDGDMVGIFTERDALFRVMAVGASPETIKVGDVMTPNPVTVATDMPFTHALHLMQDHDFRHLPVTSRDGGLIGIVSIRDAAAAELAAFEAEAMRKDHLSQVLA